MSVASALSVSNLSQEQNYQYSRSDTNALIIEKTLNFDSDASDSSSLQSPDLPTSLSYSAEKIIAKINELLEAKGFQRSQDLKPQDVSSEATSDRVVTGITALFDAFAKQNKDLNPEELVSKFIEEAKKGVELGYSQAASTLKDLGAFELEGIEDSVSKTRDLILEKLDKYAEFKLEQLSQSVSEEAEKITENELLNQIAA